MTTPRIRFGAITLAAVAAAVTAPRAAAQGPDVTFCELYGLQPFGQEGDIVGMAGATTSWNRDGTETLIWEGAPDPRHPFITQNVYRIDADGTFRHIGQSWCKNGFFALSFAQCGGSCTATDGSELGLGCTDTYSASLNAQQTGNQGNSPRYETNPWTGQWDYSQSTFLVGGVSDDAVSRRLQLDIADIDPNQNPGAEWFYESYYLHRDDTDHMDSTAWKPCSFAPTGNTWGAIMSGSATMPNEGWAIDAWTGATQTVIAQEIPVVENVSPDGRCILAAKAFDEGGGQWRYVYVILNIDMARQVGSFAVPLPDGASVTNVGMHAARHHNEPINDQEVRIPIDNAPWTHTFADDQILWSTGTNPIRWATAYTFWFTCDVAPGTGAATLGHFNPGSPGYLTGTTVTPDGVIDAASIPETDPDCGPDAGQPHTVSIELDPGAESIAAATLHYCTTGACAPFDAVAMTNTSGNTWQADIPPADCDDPVEYYITVTLANGSTVAWPPTAPSDTYALRVGQCAVAFEDDFETDQGWTVNFDGNDSATGGIWERVAPVRTDAQADRDRSPVGTLCYVTGQHNGGGNGANDVDGGVTTLTSPVFHLSSVDEATISYWRWYSNSRGGASNEDTFTVEISDDNGASWTTVETIGPNDKYRYGDWFRHEFDPAMFVSLTDQIRLRFVASDFGNNSLVEAGIDDVRIDTHTCIAAPPCEGDANDDGNVDVNDITYVIFRLGDTGTPGSLDGDANGDGAVDSGDIGFVIFRLGPCP